MTLCSTCVCHLQSTKLQNSIDGAGKEVIGDALHGLDKYAQQKQQDDSQHQKKTDETLNKIAKVRNLGHSFASLAVFICRLYAQPTRQAACNDAASVLRPQAVDNKVLQDTHLSMCSDLSSEPRGNRC